MKNFSLLLLLLFALSCKKNNQAPQSNDYNRGRLTILTDDAFKSVTKALADAYMINYPETNIDVKVMKEDLGLLELLKEKAKLIVMSRDLTKDEISEYERITDLKYQPAKFAADAVVFITDKNATRNSISVEEISNMLNGGNQPIVFDGTNSGNLNFVAQKLNRKPSDLKFKVVSGNESVIRHIAGSSGEIGVISLNTISREFSKKDQELKNLVKILPVNHRGRNIEPIAANLRDMSYPFTRVIYFVGNEGNFQLANGIMRFSCTQLGQMVVEKEGLQPYNLYKREVQMR